MFLGREHEERVVTSLIAGVPQRGGALVVVGDPGIGKSTLAELARQSAIRQGLTVLAATGVPAESRLPYAGLHQLLRPLRDGVGDLPRPQRDAILAAFGQTGDQVPDRFLVALAVTELVAAAASRQPLIVLADDAHWLDPATCEVLTFLGRRISGEPIVLLATTRDGYQLPLLEAGLAELRLDGLGEEAAGQLLDTVAPGLTFGARREILDMALGNPLALTELSSLSRVPGHAEMSPTGPGFTAITHRIEKAFAARWGELPGATRTVLLVAALNEGGTLRETLDAAAMIQDRPVTAEAVTPAISARLVEADATRLRFRHPLVRSAIEYRVGPGQLAAAHQALAAVLPGQPDRRAWHRAAAALGPDEDVAAELDEAASRAVRQAAVSVAITALERAVELSTDPAACTSRLLLAAQLSFELGRPALVERFVQSIARTGLSVTHRARLALLEESIETGPTEGRERIRYLTGLARDIAADGQADLALDLLLGAARRCWWADPGREVRLHVAVTATELALDPMHPVLQSVLAFAAPDAYGTAVRDRLASLSREPGLDAVQLAHLGIAGTVLGAFDHSRLLLAAAIPQLREQGRLGLLVRALNHDSLNTVYTCQWSDAIVASDECEQAAVQASQHRWVAIAKVPKAMVAALRGDNQEMEWLASEAERVLLPAATGSAMALVQIARGLAALGHGDYEKGYQHLMRIYDPADIAFNHLLRYYHIGDLADAASHSGHRDQARSLLAELTAAATQEPGPLLAASAAFATVMLSGDEDTGQRFEQALTDDLQRWPFYHARLKLEYGTWLRRNRQAARSREHLRQSRDILDALGASAWRQRADAELRASGARDRPAAPLPSVSRFDLLTPQEQRIARMVLTGLSNREIGERLAVSHRTIGYHLYRMFPKLGITSRAELAAVLAEAGAAAGPTG